MLVPLWLPKWLPEAPQNLTNSTKSQPKHKKEDFLKMSTSPTRNTHFRGSRVPQTHPKSTKNTPKVPQKAHRFLDRFVDCFFLDFSFILGSPWNPIWCQNLLKWGAAISAMGSGRKLRAQGSQGRWKTPKILQKALHLDPQASKMLLKGWQTSPRSPHH